MADISKIQLPSGTTYNLKDTTKIIANSAGNTQQLYRPLQLNGVADNTLDAKINVVRSNRLAFLPASQIIVERTTDGGATWVSGGYSDDTKRSIFAEVRTNTLTVPLLDGVRNINCGIRFTITAMRYSVPSGTAETARYNYWNSNYISSAERYCQLKEFYFWVNTANGSLSCTIERSTGGASTTWTTVYTSPTNFGLSGWSGADYIRISQGTFGGGTTQTSNYWNYRFTFFQRGSSGSTTLPTTYTTSAAGITEIRGYGDSIWTSANNYMNRDHMYSWDVNQNVTFPQLVTATGGFSGNLTGTASGNIATPSSASNGQFLMYNGSSWVASSLPIYDGTVTTP